MFVNGSEQMCNLYRGPSIDASYQVLDHLAKRFQRRRFIDIDQSETRIITGYFLYDFLSEKSATRTTIHS
jgi:hypothetical protein